MDREDALGGEVERMRAGVVAAVEGRRTTGTSEMVLDFEGVRREEAEEMEERAMTGRVLVLELGDSF